MYHGPEYHKYIESERWKTKCSVYWKVAGRYCRACGSTKNLHVHHMSYDNFGQEPVADLAGLCHTCHLEVHRLHRAGGRKDLRVVTMEFIRNKRRSQAKRR